MEINFDNLIKNGFKVYLEDKEMNFQYLKKDIERWSFNANFRDNKLSEFCLEADGGYDYSGDFDLSHFKHIDQITKLENALLGNL